MRFNCLVFITLILSQFALSQDKMELERLITADEFPQQALLEINPYLNDARSVKYFQESDGAKFSFEVKFKKGKLRYSVEFDPQGLLEDVEIEIKEVDIPSASLEALKQDLNTRFTRIKFSKIQQQYPHTPDKEVSVTLRNAFQNLLLPEIRYELIVKGKEGKKYQSYEILYDAQGTFLSKRLVRYSDKRIY